MTTLQNRAGRTRLRLAAIAAVIATTAVLAAGAPAQAQPAPQAVAGFPAPTEHTQKAYDPEADFTAKWTRADARQLQAMSDPAAASRENSMPEEYTMPTVPQDFPDMSNEEVWVWDSWTLTDGTSAQPSFKGWEVVFSLVADRKLGFDDRHTYAKLGYFFRKADVAERPEDGGWTYGGLVFPDGASGAIFEDQSFSHQTEWSGSTRIFDGNKLRIFYTAVAFYRNDDGSNRKPYDPRLVQSEGRLFADENGVWMTGFRDQHDMLQADGEYYQTGEQNEFFNFRDPFTFEDPAHPGKTYMVFEGNSAFARGERACTEEDMGYAPGDPHAETADEAMDKGAHFQMANVGLAVAENAALTEWRFLPPILSANCVNDQTERPQIYIKDGKYYLFTITHRGTYAAGIDGPEGVYGFVGDGIRSDFEPVNRGSGLALGSPANLNFPAGTPFAPNPDQHPGQFQAYSHYVMPDGLVQSFIDTIGTSDDFVRGGTLAPTVRLDIEGEAVTVDRSYGTNGLGEWADIPSGYAHEIAGTSDPRPIG
ncbi:glycoside hydrolase family 68 protein [Microbacterium proteolyticum]|uniref:glycoside hydrolase family 68 protein n=1 Tax=Microbacterium proteolyticum TaxID=1572644 RepID=UPI001FABB2A1|nr:glycoside hydrolase family 68 protein [Microbacterium proteolyticum]MCI9857487.1 glycoside hydrolase family 68 protein [Microbacterium proteolyticum]